MERNDSLRVLETLIDFFEAGNKQTDAVAKEILESDIEYKTKWAAEIERFGQPELAAVERNRRVEVTDGVADVGDAGDLAFGEKL